LRPVGHRLKCGKRAGGVYGGGQTQR
jgi:hypothetical protein